DWSAPEGYVASQVLDRQDQIRRRRTLTGLFKQGRGAVRKPAEPGRVGRRVQEPGLHGLLWRQAGATLVGSRRDLIGAALTCSQAGLLKRGGSSGVGAERGQRQMPGPAVDIGVGQRAGQSA